MSNSKNAVLFYNHQPLVFNYYRQYDIGTGYAALFDSEDSTCILCRILDEREVQYFRLTSHRLILHESNGVGEYICIIIKSELLLPDIISVINKIRNQKM